jgi:hypothetical protein
MTDSIHGEIARSLLLLRTCNHDDGAAAAPAEEENGTYQEYYYDKARDDKVLRYESELFRP